MTAPIICLIVCGGSGTRLGRLRGAAGRSKAFVPARRLARRSVLWRPFGEGERVNSVRIRQVSNCALTSSNVEGFGRRPQCQPNRRDGPSSETLHKLRRTRTKQISSEMFPTADFGEAEALAVSASAVASKKIADSPK
jgi:hypothetical protein